VLQQPALLFVLPQQQTLFVLSATIGSVYISFWSARIAFIVASLVSVVVQR
jgi:hypothetical protein